MVHEVAVFSKRVARGLRREGLNWSSVAPGKLGEGGRDESLTRTITGTFDRSPAGERTPPGKGGRQPGLAHNFDTRAAHAAVASIGSTTLRLRTLGLAGVGVMATRCAKRSSCFFPAKRSAAVVPSRRVIA